MAIKPLESDMGLMVSVYPIRRGKVIKDTSAIVMHKSDNPTNEQVGSVVLQAVANARKLGWHLADPETWLRVEFRNVAD